MNINEESIKIWSTIGSRATLGIAALDLAKEIDNLMILTCDVSTSAGLDRFRKTYPEKYLDLGIAEQNMIGVAAGLASENFNVITTTFAPFQTMRCCEQIKVNIGYMKQKICMVGIASGLALGTFGYTHCCIEDVGVLRSIPGMTIISPADSLETVFCAGSMVHQSLEAAKILETRNVSSKVVNMHTIKPIDKLAIEDCCNSELIVSVEEHNVIGGLGSAIAEHKSSLKKSPKQLFLGIKDTYSKGGNYKFLQEKHRLTPDKIAEDILLHIK